MPSIIAMTLDSIPTKNRKKVLYIGLLIITLLIAGLFLRQPEVQQEAEPPKPKPVALINASETSTEYAKIRAIGEVESLNQVDLKAELGGKVSSVRVKIGDEVRAGDILAQFDTSTLQAQLAQANASIARAQSGVNQRIAGATDEERAQASEAVKAAQAALDAAIAAKNQTKAATDNAINQAQIALNSAKETQNNLSSSSNQSNEDVLNSAVDILRLASVSAESTLFTITDYQYAYFNCTNDQICIQIAQNKEKAIQEFLGASGGGKWNNTAIAEREGGTKALIESLNTSENPTEDEVLSAINSMLDSLNAIRQSLAIVRGNMDSYLAQGSSPADKQVIDGARASLEQTIASLSSTKSAILNTEIGIDANEDSIEFSIAQAQQQLESTILQAKTQLEQADSSIAIQEAALQQAIAAENRTNADPRGVDIAPLRADVANAQAGRALIAANLEKANIRAPFSGTVASIDADAGEFMSPGSFVASIVNEQGLQVKTYINEQDRMRISEGSAVTINNSVNGIVQYISPSLDTNSRKVEVIITVSDENPELFIGSFVNLDIAISQDRTEFYLPLSAIRTTSTANYIFIINEDSRVEQVQVELGSIIGETVEVKSGVYENMLILESTRGLRIGEEVTLQ